ncbi:MAG: glycosyltransferase family 4 protein, partial [Alphaproteobacteria bacterium]|nr:glycosyltransferase family 4 protein [Alphaproteobacteria bacterium]
GLLVALEDFYMANGPFIRRVVDDELTARGAAAVDSIQMTHVAGLEAMCSVALQTGGTVPGLITEKTGDPGLARLELKAYADYLAASLLPGLRHLHTEDGFGPGEEHGPFWRRSAFRRIALRKAEKVIVPSLVLRDIAKSAWHIPKRRLAYIANGIDCALYADKPAPAMLPEAFRADDTLLIGTLATLRKEKNLYRLLAAFQIVHASLPNARLVVVGDGVERTGLEERTRQMGLREQVHFAGHLQQPERIVGLFDVFALSSDTEQMPISVLEAMAAGLPVAAVAVGDVPGMVARENADCIVRRGDGEALARVILELLRSPERRLEIGAANRARAAQHYSLEQMLRQHGDLWRGAAPGAAAPG